MSCILYCLQCAHLLRAATWQLRQMQPVFSSLVCCVPVDLFACTRWQASYDRMQKADSHSPHAVSCAIVPRRVYRQHERPHFPPGTWTKYQSLAESCWSADPDSRPQFDQIIQQLQQLLGAAGGPITCASPFVPDADVPGSTVR
jgi:hypothetical protein